MTIDEAIKHCETVAKEIRWQALKERMDIEGVAECETCAEEHEQLAEWLKELKDAREELAEWNKLKLICANEGIVVYKVKE